FGALSAADLAEFEGEWVVPLSTVYRDWTVYEIPPNGQGLVALFMLNILERISLGAYGHYSADALHALIEAKKLAYADLASYVADPRFNEVAVQSMLSKAYAMKRGAAIDPFLASDECPPGNLPDERGDTTYLSVVDRDGNMVSLIQSNFASFGAGIVPEG